MSQSKFEVGHASQQRKVPTALPRWLVSLAHGYPSTVLIHGVAGSNMMWNRMVPLLEPYFTVIRVDLLGYGHSPKPRVQYTPLRRVTAIRNTSAHHRVTPRSPSSDSP
jgi:pimeloyl-ACP methyl ester carboxylesterase